MKLKLPSKSIYYYQSLQYIIIKALKQRKIYYRERMRARERARERERDERDNRGVKKLSKAVIENL
jgi:hypothetical protein